MGALLLLSVGSATAFSVYYGDRALPGTSLAGEEIAGLDRAEVLEIIESKANATTVDLKIGDDSRSLSLSDLGYEVDSQATVDAVFAANASIGSQFSSVFSQNDVPIEYAVDQSKLDAVVTQIEEENGSVVADAKISLPEGASSYEYSESTVGVQVNTDDLKEGASQAATTLTPVSVQIQLEEVQPTFTTEQAAALVAEANEFVNRQISITDGVDLHVPTDYEKALWLDVSPAGVQVNEEKVRAWVDVAGVASNLDPKAGIRNVNSRGDVVSVVEEGKSGWKANNIPEVADELLAALRAGEGFTGDFDFDEVKSDKWEDREIADGAENLAYQAAPGEKWIDINLSNFTVSAYEGATIVRGPVPMVPGAPATPTVTGTYKMYHMTPSQTMRGSNADGTKYETPDVPWVAYFHEGYALHGAYWRSEFGYGGPGGSHGCINMPVDEAKWFYDWAEIGTTVTSHY